MKWKVYFAHAPGEEQIIEKLAAPISAAGYDVQHRGTVMVGDSVLEEASKILSTGCPLVLCGTVKAIGTGWARRIVNASRAYSGVRIFAVQLDQESDIQTLAFDGRVADYWKDPALATKELLESLEKYYPLADTESTNLFTADAERRYRDLALQSCDIIDLANLPEDRHVATRQLELRRLYVPLRIRVEATAQADVGDEQLEAIERRREARRRGSTPWSQEDTVGRVPIGERLAKSKRLVVLGDPGAGKSTMVRWLATAYLLRLKSDPDWKDLPDVATLPNEDWLPIMIRCRDLDLSCISLDDVLQHILRKSEITEAESKALKSILTSRISQGSALLLVDGLDEISDPISRAAFCQQIERISVANPNVPIVVTSRVVGYREMGYRIGRGFEHVSVDDLSPDDKDDFARRWCTLTQTPDRRDAAVDDLIKDIHSTSRIERLTGNPMLLTTMALVKRKVGKLPRRRIDLYWEAVQVLLNWRSEVDQPIDHREALPQLEYVAYAMCQQGSQQLRDDEIISLFERMREEYPRIHAVKAHTPEAFLQLLERRTGILVQAGQVRYQGKGVPIYEFRHLTFQEYLAALALVDGRFPDRDSSRGIAETIAPLASRTETRTDAQGNTTTVVSEAWREALRLCVACCKDDEVDDVMEAILEPLPEEQGATVRSRAILAALCLADEPNVSEGLAMKVLQRLAGEFSADLDEADEDVEAAFKELGGSRWGNAAAKVSLQEYRRYVLTEDVRALKLFLTSVTTAAVFAPKQSAIRSAEFAGHAAQLHSPEEVVLLTALSGMCAILSDGEGLVEPSLVVGSEFVATLFSLLREADVVASAAAVALLACSQTSPPLWEPSEIELEEAIRVAEAATHGVLLVTALVIILGDKAYAPAFSLFTRLLNHPTKMVRLSSVEGLKKLGNSEASGPLVSRLHAENDQEEQQTILDALAKLNYEHPVEFADPSKAAPLLGSLMNSNVGLRRAAAAALGVMGYARASDALLSRLNDEREDASVRGAAAEALGAIGDERTIEPLIAALQSSEWGLQASASRALGAIGIAALPQVLHLLTLRPDLSYHAGEAIARMGPVVVEPLISCLDTDDGPQAQAAAEALARIGDPRATTHLIAKLDSPEFMMRWQAATGLGYLGGPEAIRNLRVRLRSGEYAVTWALLKASLPTLDEADRALLSAQYDGKYPLDPQTGITEARVLEASSKLELPPETVRRRYTELAPQFALKLEWENAAP